MTFNTLVKKWQSQHDKSIAESTAYKIDKQLQNHVLTQLGSYQENKITRLQVQEYVNNLQTKLTMYKKTVQIVNSIFRYGLELNILKENPLEFVDLPKQRKAETVKDFYEKEEVQVVLSKLEEIEINQKTTFFRLLLFSGIRKGEALALTWNDLNFKNHTLSINKSVSRSKDGLYLKDTKMVRIAFLNSIMKHYIN